MAEDNIKMPMTSEDTVDDRISALRELIPEAFTEGKIDFAKLEKALGEFKDDSPERYGLSWAGKSDAIRAVQSLSAGTLVPCKEESVNFDTTENLIVEGDNLEVLKLLQKSYYGKIKMIYIDPPYNKAGDFVYPDNFHEGLQDYLRFSGQIGEDGTRLSTDREQSGRYHSKWLSMMYPRLFLANNLLRDDGSIFVSIDDKEVHNLWMIMCEIFGEENVIGTFVWKRRSGSNDALDNVSVDHEYVMVARRSPNYQFGGVMKEFENYKNPNNDQRGPWAPDNLTCNKTAQQRPNLSSIPKGSKVILTSRIGLGEIELRYKLEGMDKQSAASLMRQYASLLNVEAIYKLNEGNLIRYSALLYHNPLLIKWFIASVAAGSDPSKLLNRESDSFMSALKFCFENLFERLSELERRILWTIASARKPLNRAELYYLLKGIERDDVEWALNTLHHSSMLRTANSKKETGGIPNSEYLLTETAQEYVSHCAPPPKGLFSSVQNSLKEISNALQSHAVMQAIYKYDLQSVHASTREQRICAVWLKHAIDVKKKGDLEEARRIIKEAKSVLPTYSESYRISAWIETDDPYTASNEYLTAIEYDPNSAIAYYAYAMFLIKIMQDHDEALRQLDLALKFDPNDPTLRTAKALCQFRLGNCKDAAGTYESILVGLANRPRKWRLSTWDQAAECYRRWAEQNNSLHDYTECRDHLKRALQIIEDAYAAGDRDQLLDERLARIISDSFHYSAGTGDESISQYACEVALRFFNVVKHILAFQDGIERYVSRFGINSHGRNETCRILIRENNEYLTSKPQIVIGSMCDQDEGQEIDGTVAKVVNSGQFGFIVDIDDKEWFFHLDAVINPPVRMEMMVGKHVSFYVGNNSRGECAIRVTVR